MTGMWYFHVFSGCVDWMWANVGVGANIFIFLNYDPTWCNRTIQPTGDLLFVVHESLCVWYIICLTCSLTCQCFVECSMHTSVFGKTVAMDVSMQIACGFKVPTLDRIYIMPALSHSYSCWIDSLPRWRLHFLFPGYIRWYKIPHVSTQIKYHQISNRISNSIFFRQTTGSLRGSQQHSGEAGAAPYGRP